MNLNTVQDFRHDVYGCFPRAADALFNTVDALEQRVRSLNAAGLIDAQIAAILNAEGYPTARLHHPFTGGTVWLLREKWDIPTVKINGKEHNPAQGKMAAIRLKALRPDWESSQGPFTRG